jgi:nucleotide-binding universal stress UspA family protein
MPADQVEIKKIVAALDLSKYSEDTFLHALTLTKALGAKLVLLNVIDTRYLDTLAQYDVEGLDREKIIRQTVDAHRESIEKDYLTRAQGVDIEVMFKHGLPWEEIIHAIKEMGTDLLVVGSKGHSDVAGVLFGSVAEKLQRRASCPVLVVRGPEHMRAAK